MQVFIRPESQDDKPAAYQFTNSARRCRWIVPGFGGLSDFTKGSTATHFMKAPVIVVLGLLLVGCQSSRQGASLTPEQAKLLATGLANDKADALYHCQPFHDSSLPKYEAGHWIWTDRHGVGTGDVEARVELAADGSTNSVEIRLMDSKNLGTYMGW